MEKELKLKVGDRFFADNSTHIWKVTGLEGDAVYVISEFNNLDYIITLTKLKTIFKRFIIDK